MVGVQVHQEVRAAVRRWLGPSATLLRGRVRVLAAHLADGEAVEAVVVASTALPFGPTQRRALPGHAFDVDARLAGGRDPQSGP